jgi:alkylhydroperoxidase/carboxymuconolactone decarboxylase family protein YurZ
MAAAGKYRYPSEASFRIHVMRALGAGATTDDVRAVVRFAAQFGMTKAWRGLRALNALLAENYAGSIFS